MSNLKVVQPIEKINGMDDVVSMLCKSIENDLDRWEITTHTLNDLKEDIAYWTTNYSEDAITQTWSGNNTDDVFTLAQGRRLYKSLEILKEKKSSVAQQKVIDSLTIKAVNKTKETPVNSKKWWKIF